MLPTTQNTALILFTRTPQDELAHKRILGKRKTEKQKQFFKFLVQHAQDLGQQSGLPFFVVDSNSQKGRTFGERLQQAFASFFAQGFTKVIAIGNDCVQLSGKDIKQAANKLQNKKAVFGPAQDGGVYLLGLDQTLLAHNPGFTQINWQTATVLTELKNWCSSSDIFVLPEIYADLDTYQDLKLAFTIKQLPTKLLSLLSGVFSNLSCNFGRYSILIFNQFTSSFSFRGPPVF